jgi:hypothetical protein
MHWDGTITLGNILTIAVFFFSFLAFYSKMVRLFAILQEYPPHRHNGDIIVYPRGMKPDDGQKVK